MDDVFFSLLPNKRPIICISILGKTNNCSPVGNMQKRNVKKMRAGEKEKAIMHMLPLIMSTLKRERLERISS